MAVPVLYLGVGGSLCFMLQKERQENYVFLDETA